MIKKIIKRRKECTTVDIFEEEKPGEKIKYRAFSQHCGFYQSTSTAGESHSVGRKFYILSFDWVLSTSAMSIDMS